MGPLLEFVCIWERDEQVQLDSSERDRLKELPRKDMSSVLGQKEMSRILFSLVDILYAFAYDYRTAEGEHTVSLFLIISFT